MAVDAGLHPGVWARWRGSPDDTGSTHRPVVLKLVAAQHDAIVAAGLDVDDALWWAENGVSPRDFVAFSQAGIPLDLAIEWVEFREGEPELQRCPEWIDAMWHPDDVEAFIAAGVSVDDAMEWAESGCGLSEITMFVEDGVALAVAVEWLQVCEDSIAEPADLRSLWKAGHAPFDPVTYQRLAEIDGGY